MGFSYGGHLDDGVRKLFDEGRAKFASTSTLELWRRRKTLKKCYWGLVGVAAIPYLAMTLAADGLGTSAFAATASALGFTPYLDVAAGFWILVAAAIAAIWSVFYYRKEMLRLAGAMNTRLENVLNCCFDRTRFSVPGRSYQFSYHSNLIITMYDPSENYIFPYCRITSPGADTQHSHKELTCVGLIRLLEKERPDFMSRLEDGGVCAA